MRRWLAKRPLAGVLVLGLIGGAISVAVIPAWWHYDEPGHFEYVWLAAHSPTWPVDRQYDQAMRREMAVSMLRFNWYGIRNFKLDLHGTAPIFIGQPQVGDKPGYYFLAALPLRLIPKAPIIVQYYAARLISLLLLLLILVAAWYALGEILPGNHPLRWMVTVFIALLPAFADTMASVNNDVSAVLAATLTIWACLRLIQQGYSVGRILFLAASLAACYLSKSTALFAFALAPIALVLAWLRGRFQAAVWAGVGLAVVLVAALTLTWGGPRAWYEDAVGDYPARLQTQAAPVGKYVFQLSSAGTGPAYQIRQMMPSDQVSALRGKTATLGAWVWANQPTQAGPFFIEFFNADGTTVDSSQALMDVTTKPVFHEVTFDVPGNALYATVCFQQTPRNPPNDDMFLDGLILVPGSFAGDPPRFANADGSQGEWDGKPFQNLLRNASAEEPGFELRKSVISRTAYLWSMTGGVSPALLIITLQDWRGSGWYYTTGASTLFRTFWASLAGNKVVIRSVYVNDFLLLLSALGVSGALILLWARRRSLRWDLVGFLGIALAAPWALALARGSVNFLGGDPLYPWARYAFPAILPTALLLCSGWMQWMDVLASARRLPDQTRKAIVLIIMLAIYAVAILNAAGVFHPVRGVGLAALALLLLFLYAIFGLILQQPTPQAPGSAP